MRLQIFVNDIKKKKICEQLPRAPRTEQQHCALQGQTEKKKEEHVH